MEKRVASILLLLSVEALLVAAGLSAAGSGDADIILLPSDGGRGNKERPPWKCCNTARCTRSQPPRCQCLDKVEHCSHACKKCLDVEGSSKVCADWYVGQPPRRCDDDDQDDDSLVHGGGSVVTGGTRKGDDDERPPWKCCNRPVTGPSTSETPVWYCMDRFERCECEHCAKAATNGGHHRYICLDGYKGSNPGPSCTHDDGQI